MQAHQWTTRVALALVSLLLIAHQEARAQASGDWTRGYAMGTSEAIVRAGDSSLNVYCPDGIDPPIPGMFLQSGETVPVQAGTWIRVVFDVDGTPIETEYFQNEQSMRALHLKADNHAAFDQLTHIIERMQAGSKMTVSIPETGWSQQFSLRGSSKALSGILQGCNYF